MTDSRIAFQGDGPYSMPLVLRAEARGHSGNGVTLWLDVLEPETQTVRSVSGQLTEAMADSLAPQLYQAVLNAQKR